MYMKKRCLKTTAKSTRSTAWDIKMQKVHSTFCESESLDGMKVTYYSDDVDTLRPDNTQLHHSFLSAAIASA